MFNRFFAPRRALLAEADMWRDAYNRELRRRLDADDKASDARNCAFVNALAAERLRSLLATAHFRNPTTGRLSPRGVLPAEEQTA